MKKFLILMFILLSSPAFAWYCEDDKYEKMKYCQDIIPQDFGDHTPISNRLVDKITVMFRGYWDYSNKRDLKAYYTTILVFVENKDWLFLSRVKTENGYRMEIIENKRETSKYPELHIEESLIISLTPDDIVDAYKNKKNMNFKLYGKQGNVEVSIPYEDVMFKFAQVVKQFNTEIENMKK